MTPTTTEGVTPELRPCPFCGSGMDLLPSLGNPSKEFTGRHPENDCLLSGCGLHHAKFDKWNTRPTDRVENARLREAESLLMRFVGTIKGDDQLMMDHDLRSLVEEYSNRAALSSSTADDRRVNDAASS